MRRTPYLFPVIFMVLLWAIIFSGQTVTHALPEDNVNLTAVQSLLLLADNISIVSILLGDHNVEEGLFLDDGGDVDTEVVSIGSPDRKARRTGNGQVLPAIDGNLDPDFFMQFRVADNAMFASAPTTRVRIEVEYFDQGMDTFSIQYDAISGGPYGNGTFKDTGSVTKSNSLQFQTVAFKV